MIRIKRKLSTEGLSSKQPRPEAGISAAHSEKPPAASRLPQSLIHMYQSLSLEKPANAGYQVRSIANSDGSSTLWCESQPERPFEIIIAIHDTYDADESDEDGIKFTPKFTYKARLNRFPVDTSQFRKILSTMTFQPEDPSSLSGALDRQIKDMANEYFTPPDLAGTTSTSSESPSTNCVAGFLYHPSNGGGDHRVSPLIAINDEGAPCRYAGIILSQFHNANDCDVTIEQGLAENLLNEHTQGLLRHGDAELLEDLLFTDISETHQKKGRQLLNMIQQANRPSADAEAITASPESDDTTAKSSAIGPR